MPRFPIRLAAFDGSIVEATIEPPVAADGSALAGLLAKSRFVECEIEGKLEWVHLAWVAYLETDESIPERQRLERLGAHRRPAELLLVSGEGVSGDLLYLAPPERASIADGLFASGAFLLLADGDRTRFVNRDAVTRLRAV